VENSTVFQGNSAIGGSAASNPSGGNAYGGAICIAGGTADISGTFFGSYNSPYGKGNTAQAGGYVPYAGRAYGGAVYIAAGTVKMSADTVGNPHSGGLASNSNSAQSAMNSYGGGIYVGGGTVTLTNDTIVDNSAVGGSLLFGGGVCVSGGTVTLTNDTIMDNSAGNVIDGGFNSGYGGGIYIASGATVYLDSFTLAHTENNVGIDNIYGTYTLLP
jgi:hypothetical protein